MSVIEADASNNWFSQPVTVGTTPAALVPASLVAAGYKSSRGLQIHANEGNSDTIYIGKSDVTTLTGYPLKAGRAVFIPISHVNEAYAISGSGGQVANVIGV